MQTKLDKLPSDWKYLDFSKSLDTLPLQQTVLIVKTHNVNDFDSLVPLHSESSLLDSLFLTLFLMWLLSVATPLRATVMETTAGDHLRLG